MCQPEDGCHLTVDLTDRALEFIKDAKAVVPDKPFCQYYAPGACHAPHHVPKEWIARYRGRVDRGYEAICELTLARQRGLGIVPEGTELPPINPSGTPANGDHGARVYRSCATTRREVHPVHPYRAGSAPLWSVQRSLDAGLGQTSSGARSARRRASRGRR